MVKMSGRGKSAVEKVEEYKLALDAKCKKMSLPEAQCRQVEHYVNMQRSAIKLREIEHNNQMMIELLSYRANDLDRVSKSILEIKRSRRRFDG
jgi:hypothetical protein